MPANEGNSVASASVQLTADVTDLNAGLASAEKSVNKFATSATSASNVASAAAQRASQLAGAAVKDIAAGADAATVAANSLTRSLSALAARSGPIGILAAACVSLGVVLGKVFGAKAAKELEEYRNQVELTGKAFDAFAKGVDESSAHLDKSKSISDSMISGLARMQMALTDAIKAGADPEALRTMKGQIERAQKDLTAQIKTEQRERAENAAELDRQSLEKTAAERKRLDDEALAERLQTMKLIADGQESMMAQKRKELEMEERIRDTRIRGIIDYRRELESLWAAQSAGFNGEGSNNSLQGSIDALEIAVRGAAARMGGT